MHYRALGKSGLQVSEVGMGCNRLGESGEPESHWVALVHRAIDLGVTIFDSSESYGWGRSEEMLGQSIGNRDDVFVATKVSRVKETNAKDFSAARIVAQLEASLRRLRRERVDVFQLHSPSLEDLQQFDWPEAMLKLKAAGKIRLSGVSINDAPSGEWLISNGLADVLQVPYNLLEPAVGRAVFPKAEAAGVGVMVRVPMAQGILTGKFHAGETVAAGHRAHLAGAKMAGLIERAERARSIVTGTDLTLGQFALRYCLAPKAVSAVIPGARSIEQLAQNVAASNGRGLDPEQVAAIERLSL